MKNKILKRKAIIILLIIQIILMLGGSNLSKATIEEGRDILLQADHECDSLLEYWVEQYGKWEYETIWYSYYTNEQEGNKYPAFAIVPQTEGIGTKYNSYKASISKKRDDAIWKILNKGYMGTNYKNWNLEYEDDLYIATSIALYSYTINQSPKEKYKVGTRETNGISIEEIQRRATNILDVAEILYEYGIYGKEGYVSPEVIVEKDGIMRSENIDGIKYCVQNYKVSANRYLESYEVEIKNFIEGTKILNSENKENSKFLEYNFKIAIPMEKIKKEFIGEIYIKNAKIETKPIYYCKSSMPSTQNYITYASPFEYDKAKFDLNIKPCLGNLKVAKLNNDGKIMPNVTFALINANGEKIGEYTTNEKGVIDIKDLEVGKYKLKEIKTQDGYELLKDEIEINIEWKCTTYEVIGELNLNGDETEKVEPDENLEVKDEQKNDEKVNITSEADNNTNVSEVAKLPRTGF